MIAQFAWYDWPEYRAHLDASWGALVAEAGRAGIALPLALIHSDDIYTAWDAPDLTLAMCCGWQVAMKELRTARPVAHLDWEGCLSGRYHSKIVCSARDEEIPLSELLLRPAINGKDSWSGYHALRHWAGLQGMQMGEPLVSGGHRNSIDMVQRGSASIAAIDHTCWRMAEALGETDGLVIRAETAPAASIPVIAGPAFDLGPAETTALLNRALQKPASQGWAGALGLRGFLPVTEETYAEMAAARFVTLS